jgi:D-aminopeptidase
MIARGLADYGVPVEVVAGDIGAEVDRVLQGISGQPLKQFTEPSTP